MDAGLEEMTKHACNVIHKDELELKRENAKILWTEVQRGRDKMKPN